MKGRNLTRKVRGLIVAVATAAVLAPVAQAYHGPKPPVWIPPQKLDAATRHHHNLPAAQPRTTTVVVEASRSFDWGDAGIGAAAGLGAVSLVSGSALVLRRNHRRPSRALKQA